MLCRRRSIVYGENTPVTRPDVRVVEVWCLRSRPKHRLRKTESSWQEHHGLRCGRHAVLQLLLASTYPLNAMPYENRTPPVLGSVKVNMDK